MESLVTTDWLAARLREPGLTVLDSSWHMPATGRDGRSEFEQAHIPGALFFDIDALSDRGNSAPHMLPAAIDFKATMEELGIGRDDRIVIYDNSPLRTAARGWFMLRHFGAETVAILDGGLRKWLAEGRPTVDGKGNRAEGATFAAEPAGDVVAMRDLIEEQRPPIVDARGAARFEGSEPDPRPGVAPGHIPGARNLPYATLYNEDGTFRDRVELARLFAEAGIDPERPFVASCGSGVTASSLLFAAHLLGSNAGRLYDGSWAEWGADPATPKALGPAT